VLHFIPDLPWIAARNRQCELFDFRVILYGRDRVGGEPIAAEREETGEAVATRIGPIGLRGSLF
jgi:hypothetical protein